MIGQAAIDDPEHRLRVDRRSLYLAGVDPSITNAFATAAFRFACCNAAKCASQASRRAFPIAATNLPAGLSLNNRFGHSVVPHTVDMVDPATNKEVFKYRIKDNHFQVEGKL